MPAAIRAEKLRVQKPGIYFGKFQYMNAQIYTRFFIWKKIKKIIKYKKTLVIYVLCKG